MKAVQRELWTPKAKYTSWEVSEASVSLVQNWTRKPHSNRKRQLCYSSWVHTQIQQCIEKGIYCFQIGLTPGIQRRNLLTSSYEICNNNNSWLTNLLYCQIPLEGENEWVVSIGVQKAFDKSQSPSLTSRMEGLLAT